MQCQGVKKGGMTREQRNRRNKDLRHKRDAAKRERDTRLAKLIGHTRTLMLQSVGQLGTVSKVQSHLYDVFRLVCEMQACAEEASTPVVTEMELPPLPSHPHGHDDAELDLMNLFDADIFSCNAPVHNTFYYEPSKLDENSTPVAAGKHDDVELDLTAF